MKPEPLTDAEFHRLNSVLARFGDKHSMNLEQLDGFLAALICGPDTVLPSEYLPVIWDDDIVLEDTFGASHCWPNHAALGLKVSRDSLLGVTVHSPERVRAPWVYLVDTRRWRRAGGYAIAGRDSALRNVCVVVWQPDFPSVK
jgi:hypothetical protein